MPKIEQNKIDWSGGNKLKIESIDHFNELVEKGFEVTDINYSFASNQSDVSLLLVNQNEKIVADANSIDDYVVHLVSLYDFNKKRPLFVWVPDTSLYWDFEDTLITFLSSTDNLQPFTTKQLATPIANEIYNSLSNWMSKEKYKKYFGTKLSEIFSLVCIVEEKNKMVSNTIFDKEKVSLDKIKEIVSTAMNLDNCIGLSFFLLSNKLANPPAHSGDVLLGLILYDLKRHETLAFNIQSIDSFIRQYGVDKSDGLYDIALYLFQKSISDKLLCSSFVPLPLDSFWYTALPWLSYSALFPSTLDFNIAESSVRNVSIPIFFTFGYSMNPREESSFNFSYFGSDHEGRAACILNLNDNGKRLKYIMRFDQSQGESLVHLDFSYYDSNEYRLISHRPLDFEIVYRFNSKLFVAMMSAGIFDGYFNTLIEGGLEGIQNLAKKNPAFLSTLHWVWRIETAISSLNENKIGYVILEKLFNLEELNEHEIALTRKMHVRDYTLYSEDENHNIDGLSILGYIVLQRYKRKQTEIKITQ